MAYLPIHDLTAALHIGHLASATGISLSEALQRQVRHVSYEFIQLREEQFGPNSVQTGLKTRELILEGLMEYFVEDFDRGVPEDALVEKAKLAENTLREIRTLEGAEHFFAATLHHFYEALTRMKIEDNRFATVLMWELETYRLKRDEEESNFLQPFNQYRDQVLAIVNKVRSREFTEFTVEDRIKRGLLGKLQTREWRDMQEFYDLVGLRIIVGNQREVDAVAALIEGAFRVHESVAMVEEDVPHYFRINDIAAQISVSDPGAHTFVREGYNQVYYNDRGYRAKHINIKRHCRDNGHNHPTAEIQVMSQGIHDWGTIQRLLIYKGDRIPDEVKTAVNAYCRSAADYIVGVENGQDAGQMPDFGAQILILNQIQVDFLKYEVLDRISDMDFLAGRYKKRQVAANGAT